MRGTGSKPKPALSKFIPAIPNRNRWQLHAFPELVRVFDQLAGDEKMRNASHGQKGCPVKCPLQFHQYCTCIPEACYPPQFAHVQED